MMEPMDTQQKFPPGLRARTARIIMENLPRLLLIGLLVLITILFMAVTDKKDRLQAEKEATLARERPAVNTVLLNLSPSTIRDRLNLPGEIEPWTRLELLAKISGEVIEVLVSEGDRVQEGEVLARIEEDDYRIALNSATAAFELARANLERVESLFAKGLIPAAERDTVDTDMRTARAAMEEAALNLSRCTVTAPMTGVIRRLDLKKGLLLSVADPMAEILEIDRVKAVIGIPESDVAAVRKLNTVDFTVKALDGRKITGRRHFLSPAPETAARLYRLELAVDNTDGEILPGMFIRADIVKRRVENALVIPLYAVLVRNEERFVFVEEDGTAHKRPVRLGIMEEWQVQVTDGLSAGDRLIIQGHRDVEPEQEVKVIRTVNDVKELGP